MGLLLFFHAHVFFYRNGSVIPHPKSGFGEVRIADGFDGLRSGLEICTGFILVGQTPDRIHGVTHQLLAMDPNIFEMQPIHCCSSPSSLSDDGRSGSH